MKEKKESALAQVFRVSKQKPIRYIISCLLSIVGAAAGVVPYMSVYYIAREILTNGSAGTDTSLILLWAVTAGISILVNGVLTYAGSYGCHKSAFDILYRFRLKLMEHIGRLSMGFFTENTSGSMQKTMNETIEKIESYLAHMLPDMMGSICVVIILFVSLFRLNIWLALATLLVIILAFILQMIAFGGYKVKKMWEEVAEANKNITSAFAEYINGMAEVKLFGLSGRMTKELKENIGLYKKWEITQYKRSSVPMSLYNTLIISVLSVLLPLGIIIIIRVGTQEALLAVLMALIVAPAIYDPLIACINYGAQMGELTVGMNELNNILTTESIRLSEAVKGPTKYDITFENVSFKYNEDGEESAIDGISFTAKNGEMTALVGKSGGGKSTIGQLILRFWDVTSGRILIGGVDIKDIETEVLMSIIAPVFQDTYIFADTIRNNITMNREYAEEEVHAAARAARCHDFISKLDKGYDTMIGDAGAGLSGGEVQRISIARAILKNSPIVILDEALAYSDAENENLIQKGINNLVKDKTVIVIAHRLMSIQEADRIIVLDEGQIIERGTHLELMEKEGKYSILWRLQHQADKWELGGENV